MASNAAVVLLYLLSLLLLISPVFTKDSSHVIMTDMYPEGSFDALKERLESSTTSSVPQIIADDLPDSFDGRDEWPGCIHPVLDQGDCGSCWAFAGSEALSDRFCIWEGVDVVLSPQYLLSCEVENLGCFCGSLAGFAWHYMQENGVPTYDCVPYVSGDGEVPRCRSFNETCEDGSEWTLYKAANFTHVGNFIDASAHISTIMTALTQGPLDATFNVYADFDDYTGGVYQHLYGTYEGMHSVKVIGWGVEDDEDYWLVQNSWGPDWGESGYFKILKGVNECGFEMDMYTGFPGDIIN